MSNSNTIMFLSIAVLAIVILIQLVQVFKFGSKAMAFGKIIPDVSLFRVFKFYIKFDTLKTVHPSSILARLKENATNNEEPDSSKVILISPFDKFEDTFHEIMYSINVFLLKNKSTSSDFLLLKDILERNIDIHQRTLTSKISNPLYIGVIGSMLCSLLAFVSLYSSLGKIVIEKNATIDIKVFFALLAISIIPLVLGLIIRYINMSKLQLAQIELEKSKNMFYSFVQTDVMPELTQGVVSSFTDLQSSMQVFASDFAGSLKTLNGLMTMNHSTMQSQERLLHLLETIDVKSFAEANVQVLASLHVGVKEIAKFNEYLSRLDYLLQGTAVLTQSFDAMLKKTGNLESIAHKLDSRLDDSNRLMTFLSDHYSELEKSGELMRSTVGKIEETMSLALDQLHRHAETKIEAIKEITLAEENMLLQSYSENRSHFAKLSLLSDLQVSMDDVKHNSQLQIDAIKQEMELLRDSFAKTNDALAEINYNTLSTWKRLFTSKPKKVEYTSKSVGNDFVEQINEADENKS